LGIDLDALATHVALADEPLQQESVAAAEVEHRAADGNFARDDFFLPAQRPLVFRLLRALSDECCDGSRTFFEYLGRNVRTAGRRLLLGVWLSHCQFLVNS